MGLKGLEIHRFKIENVYIQRNSNKKARTDLLIFLLALILEVCSYKDRQEIHLKPGEPPDC
jgi:hypothetical protein